MIGINPSTRQFVIPGADLVFGVESDNGSERKYFQSPRYVGNNVDIASSFIRINYRNANGEVDFHLIDDLTIDGDNVLFSWELHPKVTMYKGLVSFVVCVTGPDLKVKWHTTLGKGQVLEGLEPDSEIVEMETADSVAQLIAMVESQTEAVEKTGAYQAAVVEAAARAAQDSAVAEIEAKRVNSLGSIPGDYTALSGVVDMLTRGRAGAIVCEADGTVVSADDAANMAFHGIRIFGKSTQSGIPSPQSPVDIVSVEQPVVDVYGKNLFPVFPEVTTRGITVKYEPGGWITLNGTANPDASIFVNVNLPAGTYFFTANNNVGIGESLVDSPYIAFRDEGRNWMASNTFTVSNYARKVEASRPIASILLAVPTGLTLNNWRARFQLEIGESGTEFEEYTDQTISTSQNLRGIPVIDGGNYTDENGQQWICDEVDLERGVYVQRTDIKIFDGTETTWRMFPQAFAFVITWSGVSGGWHLHHTIASHFKCSTEAYNGTPGCFAIDQIGLCYFATGHKTLDEFKEWLVSNPVTVVCKLATPVETPLPETEIAAYSLLHSNYGHTTVMNNAGAYMSIAYAADTKLYIDKKIKEALQ